MLFPKAYSKNPAFAWWVPHTMRIRSRAISRLKATRTSKGRHRFGIQVPTTIEEAEELDKSIKMISGKLKLKRN